MHLPLAIPQERISVPVGGELDVSVRIHPHPPLTCQPSEHILDLVVPFPSKIGDLESRPLSLMGDAGEWHSLRDDPTGRRPNAFPLNELMREEAEQPPLAREPR